MTPSPKEKAKELYNKFFIITPQPYKEDTVEWEGKVLTFNEWDKDWTKKYAKQCALIAVDEIINSSPTNPLKGGYIELYSDMVDEAIEYYKEVKKEIELL